MSEYQSDSQSTQPENSTHISKRPETDRKASEVDTDIPFLLAEYDRLSRMELSQWEIYHTRFNSFMTVALGVIAAYVALVTANPPMVPTEFPIPDLLAAVILLWGGFTFLNLTEISYGIKHLVNALRAIQSYFTNRHPYLIEHLYYDAPELYEAPTRTEYFVGRWLLHGSPKSVLTAVNGCLSAILIARLLRWLQSSMAIVILGTIVALVIVCLLHPLYVRFAYRRRYLTP